MIGYLKGELQKKQPPELLVNVNGVGYLVTASMQTFYRLPALGDVATLYIQTIVREDAIALYGFVSDDEKQLFNLLTKVNGVGPKLAIGLLSSIGVEDFIRYIQLGDSAGLTRLPGIGKKTAERLLLDLRDKFADFQIGDDSYCSNLSTTNPHQSTDDAIAALIALGYKPTEAKKTVDAVANDVQGSEQIIKAALAKLMR